MNNTVIAIDIEELVDFYFDKKYNGVVFWDSHTLSNDDRNLTLLLSGYTIDEDPSGDIAGLHEIYL